MENPSPVERATNIMQCRMPWSQAQAAAEDLDRAGLIVGGRRIAHLEDEVERLEGVLADIRRMAYAFDTPRDAGRVTAFVGDLRQLIDKASRKA